eukprot:4801537-Amphidinium_carterae.2
MEDLQAFAKKLGFRDTFWSLRGMCYAVLGVARGVVVAASRDLARDRITAAAAHRSFQGLFSYSEGDCGPFPLLC